MLDLVKVRERVVPVGRLDMYTSGALILTNDGDFVYKVTHPKHEITIHEGKNRQVRRMCESVGRRVIALHRSKIGNIGVKDIELGKWRYLKDFEVKTLIGK